MKAVYFLLGTSLLLLTVMMVHRFLYRNLSARGLYALWLIPALRLLIPFGWLELPQTDTPGMILTAPYRILSETFEKEKGTETLLMPYGIVYGGGNGVSRNVRQILQPDEMLMNGKEWVQKGTDAGTTAGSLTQNGTGMIESSEPDSEHVLGAGSAAAKAGRILLIIWGAGSTVCAVYVLTVNGKMRLSVKQMERLEEPETEIPVYCGETVCGSCLFGLFRPCILIGRDAVKNPKLYPYLLRHEKTHYRQKDPIWTALRIVLCVAYWWNPLVWAAAVCAQEDGELACDARALRGLSVQEKQAYGGALLEVFQTGGRPRLFYEAVCAGGSRSSMRRRITAIAEGRHRNGDSARGCGLWVSACMLLVLVFLFGICLPKSAYAARVPGYRDTGETSEGSAVTKTHAHDEGGALTGNADGSVERDKNERSGKGMTAEKESAYGAEETDTGIEAENLTYLSPLPHRDGYREAKVQFIPIEGLFEETPANEVRETCDELAQRALRELYDLTGVQIEECVYTATPLGTFYFGRSEDDLRRSRNFYCYQFAVDENIISSFSIANARRVWYSDVQQLLLPADAAGMECAELAVWFLQRSGLCPEGYVAQTGLVYETEPELIRVTMTDGSFYEVHMDMDILAVEAIYGPYPAGAEH